MKKHIIEVPLTPNFLKYRGHAFPIADFDDEELRELVTDIGTTRTDFSCSV